MTNSKPEDDKKTAPAFEQQGPPGEEANPAENDPYASIERALGTVLHILAQDAASSNKKLKDLYRNVLPAIVIRQFRIIRNDGGEAIAYASWALVSPEVEKKISESQDPISPSDWQSGTTAMLIDLVSLEPKLAAGFVERLKKEIFPDTVFKARKTSSNGNSSIVWAEVKAAPEDPPPPATT